MLKGIDIETEGAYPSMAELGSIIKMLRTEGIPIYSISYRYHDMERGIIKEVRIETNLEDIDEDSEDEDEDKGVH